ncbi:hypothetical protein ACOMHN_060690 [Nucella lapillus]
MELQREMDSRGGLNVLFDQLRATIGGENLSKQEVLLETINLLEGLNAAQPGEPLQVTPKTVEEGEEEGKKRMAEGEMEEEGEGERVEESEVVEKVEEGEMVDDKDEGEGGRKG